MRREWDTIQEVVRHCKAVSAIKCYNKWSRVLEIGIRQYLNMFLSRKQIYLPELQQTIKKPTDIQFAIIYNKDKQQICAFEKLELQCLAFVLERLND